MRRPGRTVAIAVAVAGCGGGSGPAAPDATPPATLEVVGHADLGGRGMNAALAVAGDTVYVGSRIDGAGRDAGVLIVDVADPEHPEVVGEIGPPEQSLSGMSSRELRAVPELDLLIVLNMQCSLELHGCSETVAENENLRFYDISDRRAPVLVGRYQFTSNPLRPNGPHEFFLWRDPAAPARVLLFVTTPASAPAFEVIDVSDPAAPARVARWDPIADGDLDLDRSGDNLLHSVSTSADGRTGYFSHLQGGLFAADLGAVIDGDVDPAITVLTPLTAVADWSPPQPAGPHSAVPVPGRELLVVTDEVYPPPFGAGCPWGWLRIVDVADPAAPAVVGQVKVDENSQSFCAGVGDATTFTAHNATVTAHLALVSWHSAGLQAIDLTDPAEPVRVAELRPEPLASVDVEDPGLGGDPLLMWSYPVVQDGLIYVVDIRNGLYIVRYTGPYAEELEVPGPYEGNSNLGT